MNRKRTLWLIATLVVLALPFAAYRVWNAQLMQRLHSEQPQIFAAPVVDAVPPQLPNDLTQPAILVFSKTNGYRHKDAIPAGNRMFMELARRNGWSVFVTENAAVYNDAQLARFNAVVWNNASRPELTDEQKQALQRFIESGGGFVGIHAAGDSSHTGWDWYQSQVIRARFLGHPMWPQFAVGKVIVEQAQHPIMSGLPPTWDWSEEWYSFHESPRQNGVTVLATVDEASYDAGHLLEPMRFRVGRTLAMGEDHPIAWSHTIGKGRVFYTAMGHKADAYNDPVFRTMLEQAITWTSQFDRR